MCQISRRALLASGLSVVAPQLGVSREVEERRAPHGSQVPPQSSPMFTLRIVGMNAIHKDGAQLRIGQVRHDYFTAAGNCNFHAHLPIFVIQQAGVTVGGNFPPSTQRNPGDIVPWSTQPAEMHCFEWSLDGCRISVNTAPTTLAIPSMVPWLLAGIKHLNQKLPDPKKLKESLKDRWWDPQNEVVHSSIVLSGGAISDRPNRRYPYPFDRAEWYLESSEGTVRPRKKLTDVTGCDIDANDVTSITIEKGKRQATIEFKPKDLPVSALLSHLPNLNDTRKHRRQLSVLSHMRALYAVLERLEPGTSCDELGRYPVPVTDDLRAEITSGTSDSRPARSPASAATGARVAVPLTAGDVYCPGGGF